MVGGSSWWAAALHSNTAGRWDVEDPGIWCHRLNLVFTSRKMRPKVASLVSAFWFCREPKGHFPGARHINIARMCAAGSSFFRRGINQACFVSLLQLLPVCSHLPAQARLWSTNRVDPYHNQDKGSLLRRDVTGQQPVSAETMNKKQGATCSFGLPHYWLFSWSACA